MRTIPAPFCLDGQGAVDMVDQTVARHDAAGEEMPCDPVGLVGMVEPIGHGAVTEDMQEQPPLRRQPVVHPPQQLRPIGHVFPHLHRYDAVEARGGGKIVHIGSDHAQAEESAPRRLRLDVFTLQQGIRHGGDIRVRKCLGHPQRQRAPAAAQLQDALAVGELGVGGGFPQRPFLGLGQRVGAVVEAAGIFPPRAEHMGKELRRQLVVLGIRRLRMQGDRLGRHGGGKIPLGLRPDMVQAAAGAADQHGDAGAGDGVGKRQALDGGDKVHDVLARGSGRKGRVRAW